MTPRAGMLFFTVFLLMGSTALYFGATSYLEAEQVKDWPSTAGTVTQVGVSEVYVSGHKGSPSHYEYYPKIYYEYQVDGRTYYGDDRGKVESSFSSYADAQGYLSRYRVGTAVPVYYNPSDPGEAVLEKTTSTEMILAPLVGLLFASIGAAGLFWSYKKWKGGADYL
jgi:hypothetical protein